MADIAALAGVSVPTVSKVLNGRSDVASATRARVERVIAERGYVANRAARSLTKGRSGLVDLVVRDLESAYHFEIIRGVEQALARTDMRLVLSATHSPLPTTPRDDDSPPERQWLARIADGLTDGVILVVARGQSAHLEKLRRRGIPFVVVDHRGELGPDVPSVGATNWAGGRAATEHLLSLGHRRIAVIGGSPSLASGQARLAGYRAALDAAGLPVDPDLIRQGDFLPEGGYTQTSALLALPTPPTAIFAGSDLQAMGVYQALRGHGVPVPGGVSVVGFDDVPMAALANPPLTTVRQPLAEMGQVAAAMLLRLIQGEALESRRLELATMLVVRESCAPPARAP